MPDRPHPWLDSFIYSRVLPLKSVGSHWLLLIGYQSPVTHYRSPIPSRQSEPVF